MSRTDKTKPLWVRRAEHKPWPVHDHRFGPCDLPSKPTRERTDTRCWWPSGWFCWTCCAGPNGRAAKREMGVMNRAENRRNRYAARLEARRARGRFTATGDTD